MLERKREKSSREREECTIKYVQIRSVYAKTRKIRDINNAVKLNYL